LEFEMNCFIDAQPLSSTNRANRAFYAVVLLAPLVCAALVDPDRMTLFACPFKAMTGLDCFSCGLTHSLHAAAHLQFARSFQCHLMGPLLFLVALALLVKCLIELVWKKGIQTKIPSMIWRVAMMLLGGVWVGYYLIRLAGELQR
jgi:hypothetical protein